MMSFLGVKKKKCQLKIPVFKMRLTYSFPCPNIYSSLGNKS